MAEPESSSRHMLRVVVDTNVLVSKFISKNGTAGRAVDVAARDCRLLVCAETLAELASKLSEERFCRYGGEEDRVAFIKAIEEQAEIVTVYSEFRVSIDPKDDIFLALAYDGRADYLVTGDTKHLLPIKHYKGVQIITPAHFLKITGH